MLFVASGFYRAYFFGILEHLTVTHDLKGLDELIDRIHTSKDKLLQIGYSDIGELLSILS